VLLVLSVVEASSDLMFQDIENSAEFAKQLRQQAWRHE